MDSIREIFDALSQRIRSPVIGYVILMVLLFNWKVFFFLLFSGEPAETKFTYFDTHTDGWSLLGIPAIVGVAAAVFTPWINVAGQLAVQRPVMMIKTRNAENAHNLAVLKAMHKNAENEVVQGFIEAAKQDEQVKQIEDDEVRQRLQSQIDELRVGQSRFFPLEPKSDSRKEEIETLAMIQALSLQAENLGKQGMHQDAVDKLTEAISLLRSKK